MRLVRCSKNTEETWQTGMHADKKSMRHSFFSLPICNVEGNGYMAKDSFCNPLPSLVAVSCFYALERCQYVIYVSFQDLFQLVFSMLDSNEMFQAVETCQIWTLMIKKG